MRLKGMEKPTQEKIKKKLKVSKGKKIVLKDNRISNLYQKYLQSTFLKLVCKTKGQQNEK